MQTVTNHVPPAAKNSTVLGRVASDKSLRISIGLPLRNKAALNQLLNDLYNPETPQYRQFLTSDQFAGRFGPSEADYAAVLDFARTNGFTRIVTHPNRMLVDATATVADLQKAFHVKLGWHKHPKEKRDFYAPDADPSLELSVPVLSVSGLDNYVVPHPASLLVSLGQTNVSARPLGGSGSGGNFRGFDFRHAYAPGVSLTGSNQFVGLLQFDGYNKSDITSYESASGLPNVPLINILLDDASGAAGQDNIEVALDIEMSIAMAPGLAGVLVYEGGSGASGNTILNRMATDNVAKQLSASWTFGIDSTTTQIYQQFATQGQSYFNASGDSDAYSGTIPTPADHAWVTSVGGTTLSMNGAGVSYSSEIAWNRNDGHGTGGGVSTTYAIPTWQQATSMANNQGSTTMRNIPDVAMVADGVAVFYGGGIQGSVGGTSVASPLWAGFMALVNEQAANRRKPAVGFLNPVVYPLGNGASYNSAFHDTTIGNNFNSSSPSRFSAVAGYDLCTGWGTPTGSNLINVLVPPFTFAVVTNGIATLVAETCTPTNGVIDSGETVLVNFSLHNIGGAPTTNLVATLLASGGVTAPSAAQSYGVLPAEGSNVTRAFTFKAGGTCGSILTATLQLQDGAANLGNVTFAFRTGVPNIPFKQTFDTVSAPALPSGWTTAVSGGGVAWVTSTAFRDSLPNAAFAFEPTNAGVTELISPSIAISTTSAQLQFRNFYNCEIDPATATKAYDGGVLEIKIGTAAFTDILSAGGSFVSGGYNNKTIDPTDDNPLDGRQCWSGLSPGFITTFVNLPASAAGKNIQLKWRFATDSGNAYGTGGWYIDGVQITDGYACCVSTPPVISGQPTNQTLALGSNATFTVTATGTTPFNYQWLFAGTNLPGATAASLLLTNVQQSQAGNYQVIVSNIVASVTSTVASLRVLVAPSIGLIPGAVSSSNVSVALQSLSNLNYLLEYKNTVTDATWTPLPPSIPGTGGPITLHDTNGAVFPSRFYRVICQ